MTSYRDAEAKRVLRFFGFVFFMRSLAAFASFAPIGQLVFGCLRLWTADAVFDFFLDFVFYPCACESFT